MTGSLNPESPRRVAAFSKFFTLTNETDVISVCLFRLSEPVSQPPAAYLSFTIMGNTHALLDTMRPSCPHVCPALNISSILTQHSSVLPNEWQQCPGSLLEDSFSSWVQLDVRLGYLGPTGLPPSSWVNKLSRVRQYKAACGPGVPLVWGAPSTHPYHASYSSCSQTCLMLCVTGRRGWLNMRVPAICHSNQWKPVLGAVPRNWIYRTPLPCGFGGGPCLWTSALKPFSYHLHLLVTAAHFPFHWGIDVTI